MTGFSVRAHARRGSRGVRAHLRVRYAYQRPGVIRVYRDRGPLGEMDIGEAQFYRFPTKSGRTSGVFEISDIFVDPRFTRHGIGRELVRRAEGDIRTQGGRTIYLMSVVPEAADFWRKMGYRQVELKDRYQWLKRL